MKKIMLLLSSAMLLGAFSCTKLDEGLYDRQTASQFYATPEGINAALASLYNEVRGDWGGKGFAGADRGYYDLNEVTTDEMMIPTRTDGAWDDNGIWRQTYTHQWTPSHEFLNNLWNWGYRAVYKANLAIENLTAANASADKIAEAKVARASFYYLLMDAFGNIPLFKATTDKQADVPQSTRAEVYNWIIGELEANVSKLSETKGGEYYGRFNKWAGFALMAKMYLNAGVYKGSPEWAKCSAACDSIILRGGYSLVPAGEYFSKLFGDRCDDREVIFTIYVDALKAPRNIIGIRSLRGPQGDALFGFSTWNGATVHRTFYDKYDASDIRRAQWITGPQAGGVNYTLDISGLTGADVNAGARNTKFFPVAPYNGGSASNDYPVYRYADVLLMKAEAVKQQGGSALTWYQQVRTRAGLSAAEPTLTDIYDERGRELCWEGHRRTDMIRFGTFLQSHDFKPASPGGNTRNIYPIPGPALDGNPNLTQNPGY